jgi:hypothetical protein
LEKLKAALQEQTAAANRHTAAAAQPQGRSRRSRVPTILLALLLVLVIAGGAACAFGLLPPGQARVPLSTMFGRTDPGRSATLPERATPATVEPTAEPAPPPAATSALVAAANTAPLANPTLPARYDRMGRSAWLAFKDAVIGVPVTLQGQVSHVGRDGSLFVDIGSSQRLRDARLLHAGTDALQPGDMISFTAVITDALFYGGGLELRLADARITPLATPAP